jgi:predicted MFS family arabinose efflux permease
MVDDPTGRTDIRRTAHALPTESAHTSQEHKVRGGHAWSLVIFAFALASGVTVSVIYLPQPILAYVGEEFGADHAGVAWTATAAQFGYAIGVLLLVPLGEIRRPRAVIRIQVAATSAVILTCAIAPHLWTLCILLLIAGTGASVVQLLSPLAARLAPEGQRENATALIVAGLAVGIFGGRAGATVVAEMLGWRWVFAVAAAGVLCMVIVLGFVIDKNLPPTSDVRYLSLLRTLPSLFTQSPALRAASGYQFLAFSAFNAGWTVAALHLTDRLGYTPIEAGLFALAGLSSAVLVPFAGKLVKATGYDTVRSLGFVVGSISSIAIIIGADHPGVLAVALTGLALMNFVVQVPNQVSFYEETGDASPRANAVFIFFTFSGAAIGAELGAVLYQHWTITGTASFALAMSTVALLCLTGARLRRVTQRNRLRRTHPRRIAVR